MDKKHKGTILSTERGARKIMEQIMKRNKKIKENGETKDEDKRLQGEDSRK